MKPGGKIKREEFEKLRRESLEISEFLAERGRVNLDEYRRIIEGTVSHGRLTPMRILVDELIHMAKVTLNVGDQDALADRLRMRLGVDLFAKQREAALARIEGILSRGRIRTDTEYRLIRARIEELEGDAPRANELHSLLALAQRYEVR